MSTKLRQAVASRKTYIIEELLDLGIYKKADCHLYELCLSDLEKEYYDLVKHRHTSEKGV
ncbi:Fur-regulated basic protein FbpA [Bacillus sp. PAMC26568]|nr:Fur-regulated basic protein FbpA [Bacillus sp. PAMC26568]